MTELLRVGYTRLGRKITENPATLKFLTSLLIKGKLQSLTILEGWTPKRWRGWRNYMKILTYASDARSELIDTSRQRYELAERLSRRIRKKVISARLDGRRITAAGLTNAMRLGSKRPSLRRELLAIVLSHLKNQGLIPQGLEIA